MTCIALHPAQFAEKVWGLAAQETSFASVCFLSMTTFAAFAQQTWEELQEGVQLTEHRRPLT